MPRALTRALAALFPLAAPVGTWAQEAAMDDLAPAPFAIAVPDAALDDLRARLLATRFAPQVEGSGHGAGFDTAALREVVDAWAAFDWRVAEARLNGLPQFTVTIDGQLVHFVHAESGREGAVPLLLLHGWPSSFAQMEAIIPMLPDPADGEVAFDAIPMDGVLANLAVYWATGTIGPSMRSYHESEREEPAWGAPQVPVGCLMPAGDMFPTPREWIERQGPVARWTEIGTGGHFLEWEEPEAVAADLRAFFGPLR